MKLSVSLSEDDLEFLDQYAADHGVESRSGVVQRALALLRASELADDYAAAWDEWASADADLWETTTGDGLSNTAS